MYMSEEFNSCFSFFLFSFFSGFSAEKIFGKLFQEILLKMYGSCLYERILWQSTNVLKLSVCLSTGLSVCLSVCFTLIDQKGHRYLNPATGCSWSLAHEKVFERASHDSFSDWMTTLGEFVLSCSCSVTM